MRNPCQVLACMLRRDEEHGWPNGHNARQTTAPTCSYNCFPLFSRFRRPWTTKGDLTIHWDLVVFMNELFDLNLNDSTWYVTQMVRSLPKHQKNPTMGAMWIPKRPSWEHRSHSTWTNLGQMKGNMAKGADSPRTPLARTSWKSCTYKVCVKKIKVSWAFSIFDQLV